MENHGFDVIDAHQHFETAYGVRDALKVGQQATDTKQEGAANVELETRLSAMDAMHMRGAIIIAGHAYLRPRGLVDTMEVNDKIAAYRDRAPSRMLGAVGIVEPIYGPAAFDEVRRCREELGLVGISFHNGMQGLPIDCRPMRELMEKIGNAGLVPFIHVLGHAIENLWQVDTLAKAFPDLDMVILTAFHDPNQVQSLPDIAERHPRLYFDLSLSVGFNFFGLPQIRMIGANRFLYGTDFYSWPLMSKPFGNMLQEIIDSDLSREDKAAVLGGNISRLLGL